MIGADKAAYIRLLDDIAWMKSNISSLVRLRCYDLARKSLPFMRKLLALKLYIDACDSVPDWFIHYQRCYYRESFY